MSMFSIVIIYFLLLSLLISLILVGYILYKNKSYKEN